MAGPPDRPLTFVERVLVRVLADVIVRDLQTQNARPA